MTHAGLKLKSLMKRAGAEEIRVTHRVVAAIVSEPA